MSQPADIGGICSVVGIQDDSKLESKDSNDPKADDISDDKPTEQKKKENADKQEQNLFKNGDNKDLFKRFMRYLPKKVWQKKKCYFPFATHIIDQVTDLSVIIEFYLITEYEHDSNSNDCKGINSLSLLILSIIAFILYRIISSIWVYNMSKSWKHLILQILDLKIFHALYINFITNKNEPTTAQRYLQLLEASMESYPQIVIQSFYLIKFEQLQSTSLSENVLIIISLIFSTYNVSSKFINEDKMYFDEKWHNVLVNNKRINGCYIIRFFIRFIDVIVRVLLVLLLWIVVGGMAVSIYVLFELTLLVLLALKTTKYVNCIGA